MTHYDNVRSYPSPEAVSVPKELEKHLSLGEPFVILALIAILFGVVSLTLLLSSPSPGEDSPEAGFARDMIVHHNQAVEMARAVIDRSEDESIRSLATEIFMSQQSEIGQMQGWLDAWGLPTTGTEPAMSWMGHPTNDLMPGMASAEELAQLQNASPEEVDAQFLRLMIPHHQGALPMAQAILERTNRPEVIRLAQKIVASQQEEIKGMQALLQREGLSPVEGEVSLPPSMEHVGATTLTMALRDTARLILLPLAVLAAAWLVLGEVYRRRTWAGSSETHAPSLGWQLVAVGGLTVGAVLYMGTAPARFQETSMRGTFFSIGAFDVRATTIYGGFFCAASVVAAIAAAAILAWRSRKACLSGASVSGALIALWVAFRIVPPLGAQVTEAVDPVSLSILAADLVAAVACTVLWLRPHSNGSSEYSRIRSEIPLFLAAFFSVGAAIIHLWIGLNYFDKWGGYMMFFLILALVQGLYGTSLPSWGSRRLFLYLGIIGNLLIIALYVALHTIGIPFFGPLAGEVQGIGGVVELSEIVTEVALVIALTAHLETGSRGSKVSRGTQLTSVVR